MKIDVAGQQSRDQADGARCPFPGLDLTDAEFLAAPQEWYARMRAEAPVCYLDRSGWYVVTGLELVRQALRDTTTFSSARLSKHFQPPPELAERVAAIRAQGWANGQTLNSSDPPLHTNLRKLVNKAFTLRGLAWMEPLVRETAQELAATLPDGERVDFFTAFAEPLPTWAICRVLGLDQSRRGDVRRWTLAATATIGARPDDEGWVRTEEDLLDYQRSIAAEIEACRRSPREGLLSTLAAAGTDDGTDDGTDGLGMASLLALVRELVVAGNETSARLITYIVYLLDEHPQEWARVRAEPERATAIVEEALRLSSPAQVAFRQTTRDVQLGGVDVPAGSRVVVSFASANRDVSTFTDPDRFDPGRRELVSHVGFGLGPHMCVGAGLARLEGVLALRALADQFDALEVVDRDSLTYTPSFHLRGLEALPVVLRRRSRAPEPEVD